MKKDSELQMIIHIWEDLINLYMRMWDVALKFSWKQAVINIECQLSEFGLVFDDEGAWEVLQTEFEMPLVQIHFLKKLLTWLTLNSLEDKW
ncbi:C2H2 finger domain-containing protein [Histoplasma capsulatum H143]|uniref:C2H2 finger domain-containing protein n=1 Tax=Ajellomyces capsulatus (strain H143) TaxID=544712 RepID=C6H8W7_AJECH|nr:C2H2 finger domain-containing protein [Histoplasma capsulatum H143]